MQLHDIITMPISEVAALPAAQLFRFSAEADEMKARAGAIRAVLDSALEHRYADRAKQKRAELEKDAGAVQLEDNGFKVAADLPKRVKWNQGILAAMAAKIRESGEDPADYLDIEYKVPERKYGAWPANIRSAFEPARTVEVGKQTFKMTPITGAEAR